MDLSADMAKSLMVASPPPLFFFNTTAVSTMAGPSVNTMSAEEKPSVVIILLNEENPSVTILGEVLGLLEAEAEEEAMPSVVIMDPGPSVEIKLRP